MRGSKVTSMVASLMEPACCALSRAIADPLPPDDDDTWILIVCPIFYRFLKSTGTYYRTTYSCAILDFDFR